MLEKKWWAVISKRKRGFKDSLWMVLFYLISLFFGMGPVLKRIMYKLKILKPYYFPKKIISVGNITIGGSGKTPFVEELSKRLGRTGKDVLIVEKGYKREKKNGFDVVSDGEKILLKAPEAGDEAYMLARSLSNVKIVVSSDKIKGISRGIDMFSPDVVLLDDGFQKRNAIPKAHNVVLLNALNPLGYNRIFPAGTLREPVSALKHAETVVITNTNLIQDPELADKIKSVVLKYNRNAKVFESEHQPKYLYNITTLEKENLSVLKNKKIIVFSSIGSPAGFEALLKSLGAKIIVSLRFRDHHKFKRAEIKGIASLLGKTQAAMIVTTEKDEVRINRKFLDNTKFHALKIGMMIKNVKELEKRLRIT
ncbi:MAG: tetraacyldisaccharide 4'-kinase [Candidatus Goldiibacteriota bacterium]